MSKSLIFRIVVIAAVWMLMAKAGFGIILTLLAVGLTFLCVNIVVLIGRLVGKVLGR